MFGFAQQVCKYSLYRLTYSSPCCYFFKDSRAFQAETGNNKQCFCDTNLNFVLLKKWSTRRHTCSLANEKSNMLLIFCCLFVFCQNSYHTECSHRGLFSEDQTTSQVLLADGRRNGKTGTARGNNINYIAISRFATITRTTNKIHFMRS